MFDDFGVIAWVSAQSPLKNLNIVWVLECQLRYRSSLSTFLKARALEKGVKTQRCKYSQNVLRRVSGGRGLDPSKFVTWAPATARAQYSGFWLFTHMPGTPKSMKQNKLYFWGGWASKGAGAVSKMPWDASQGPPERLF